MGRGTAGQGRRALTFAWWYLYIFNISQYGYSLVSIGKTGGNSLLLRRRSLQSATSQTLPKKQENPRTLIHRDFKTNVRHFLFHFCSHDFPYVGVARLPFAPAKGRAQRRHPADDKTQLAQNDEAKSHGNEVDERGECLIQTAEWSPSYTDMYVQSWMITISRILYRII